MNEYPRKISYDGPRNLGSFYPDFHDLVVKVMIGLKFTMLAENIIQVEYPAELVWQIRTVDVDDAIYRLDFLLKGHEEHRIAFFPHVHWNRKNFFLNGRFNNSKRTTSDGKIVIEYPKLDELKSEED
jgi:hypothetical protein